MYKLISFMLLTCICPVSLLCGAEEITPAKAPSVDPPTKSKPERKNAAKKKSPFIFITEAETKKPDFGVVMKCPSHKHGTFEQAKEKLKTILKTTKVDSPALVVCRAEQLKTLKRFAPLADRVIINPFIDKQSCEPDIDKFANIDNAMPWSGCSHPKIKRLRLIRQIAGATKLFALVNLAGECHNTSCSLDDVRWMIYATIGSGFQGIVWRGNRDDNPICDELDIIQKAVHAKIPDVATSIFVDWAQTNENVIISTMLCGKKLLIVMLDPAFLNWESKETYKAPLELDCQKKTIKVLLNKSLRLKHATNLLGKSVTMNANSFELTLVHGSEIVLIDMDGFVPTLKELTR